LAIVSATLACFCLAAVMSSSPLRSPLNSFNTPRPYSAFALAGSILITASKSSRAAAYWLAPKFAMPRSTSVLTWLGLSSSDWL